MHHTRLARTTFLLLALFGVGVNCSTDNAAIDPGRSDAKPPAACTNGGTRVPQVHRARSIACPTARAAGDSFAPRAGDECTSDAACMANANGRCLLIGGNGRCSYDSCARDEDCPGTAVCECRPNEASNNPNVCISGDCRIDADCGATGYCSRSKIPGVGESSFGPFSSGYFCHTEKDCCMDNSDCTANGPHGDFCLFGKQRWDCGGGP
jgi:hypothetical protein